MLVLVLVLVLVLCWCWWLLWSSVCVTTAVVLFPSSLQAAVSELSEKLRMAKLEVAELQREIQVTRKILPTMPELAETVLDLQKKLAMERQTTEKLCAQLETPDNPDRWRPLEGEDPDEEQLHAKIQVLEERLNNKKEQLLEKDLVLDEVTALSEKLRQQASAGRQGTLQLSKQVNTYQALIKDTTRSMMAVVSELSMYQATAMKLSQEKEEREAALKDAVSCRLCHVSPSRHGFSL